MATPFSKTLSYLEVQGRMRTGLVAAFASALVLAWGLWLALARTTLYAVSDEGRLLASGAASPIQTPVPGVISENRLQLGAVVNAGAVLVVLDSSAETLRRQEEQIRKRGLEEAVVNLTLIIDAERGLAL